jgi:hypothetical protein
MIPLLAVGSARGEVQVDDAWNLPGHPFPFTSPSHLAIPPRYSQRPHHLTLYQLAITLAIPSDLGILSAMSSHPQRPQRSWHPQRPQRSRHPQRPVFAWLDIAWRGIAWLGTVCSCSWLRCGLASLDLAPPALARGFAAAWHRLAWHRLLLILTSLRVSYVIYVYLSL